MSRRWKAKGVLTINYIFPAAILRGHMKKGAWAILCTTLELLPSQGDPMGLVVSGGSLSGDRWMAGGPDRHQWWPGGVLAVSCGWQGD